jgi:hypothetical protein
MFSFNIALNGFSTVDSDLTEDDLCQSSTSLAAGEAISLESVKNRRFTGGGTAFSLSPNTVLRIPQGSLLAHPSRTPHAGVSIDKGTRYLLVGFVHHRVTSRIHSWTRRFGRFSRCLRIQSHTMLHTTTAKDSLQPQLQHDGFSHNAVCQSLFSVYFEHFFNFYKDLYFTSTESRRYARDSSGGKDDPVSLQGLTRLGRQVSVFVFTLAAVFCLCALIMLIVETVLLQLRRWFILKR